MIELCCEYLSARHIWLHAIIMSCMHFKVNLHTIVAWMSRNALLKTLDFWSLSDNNGIWTKNHLVCKRTRSHTYIQSTHNTDKSFG